jgi:hypothetical protein
MATPQQTIDGVLGQGWYDEWQQMELATAREKKRTEVNAARLGFKASGTAGGLGRDLRLLERVASDYRDAMNRIARGQRVDANKVGQIHDVLTLALGTVQEVNNALDAAAAVGVIAAIVAIPVAIFEQRASRLTELLEELKPLLEQAKHERNEAWVQLTINAALTGITCLMPPLGLLAKLGIAAYQSLLDVAIGPSKSTAASVGGKASHFGAAVGEAVSEADKVGRTTKRIAKGAGRFAVVTGFVFDGHEVLVGYRNVDRIKQVMARAKKAYDDLMAELQKHKPTLAKFQTNFQKWLVSIESILKTAAAIRSKLQEEIKRTGYQLP